MLSKLYKKEQYKKRKRREADVLNAYKAYNPKSRVASLADDKENKMSEKEIKDQINILIHLLEDDPQTQCLIRELYENIWAKDVSVLTIFLDLLVDKEYQTLH